MNKTKANTKGRAKKWYADWNITHNMKKPGMYTLDLPHTVKPIHVMFLEHQHNSNKMKILLDVIDGALYELSRLDKLINPTHEKNT